MKIHSILNSEKLSQVAKGDNTSNTQKSLKSKIWGLKFIGKYDCYGTEYLVGKIDVYSREDIYRVSEMMFGKINNLIRMDVELKYKLDE